MEGEPAPPAPASLKGFVIVYDSGREVYNDLREFQKPDDTEEVRVTRQLAGPMISSMAGYVSLLDERWRLVRCGERTVFLFTQRGDMYFFAASTSGESALRLQRQLRHLQDLLQLAYGPSIFKTSSATDFTKAVHRKRLQRLFQTAKKFFRSPDPSFYLMALRAIPMRTSALDHYFIEKVSL